MQAQQALEQLEQHQSGAEIPVELVGQIIGLLPQIIELISRKRLRSVVESHGKLIQVLAQRVAELEVK